MTWLFQSGKYGAINTADTSTTIFYVMKFISEAYMLQNNTTVEGKNICAGELGVKAQYIYSIHENSNWYC